MIKKIQSTLFEIYYHDANKFPLLPQIPHYPTANIISLELGQSHHLFHTDSIYTIFHGGSIYTMVPPQILYSVSSLLLGIILNQLLATFGIWIEFYSTNVSVTECDKSRWEFWGGCKYLQTLGWHSGRGMVLAPTWTTCCSTVSISRHEWYILRGLWILHCASLGSQQRERPANVPEMCHYSSFLSGII